MSIFIKKVHKKTNDFIHVNIWNRINDISSFEFQMNFEIFSVLKKSLIWSKKFELSNLKLKRCWPDSTVAYVKTLSKVCENNKKFG